MENLLFRLRSVFINVISGLNQYLAAGESFNDFGDVVKDLINRVWPVTLSIAGALVLLWGAYLGYKFWMAGGDEQKKKHAKEALISFVVGIFVIFIVAAGAPILIAALSNWRGEVG